MLVRQGVHRRTFFMRKLFTLLLTTIFLSAMAAAQVTITNLGVTATTGTTATIQWTTSAGASTQVIYGIGNLVNATPEDATLVTSHTATITGIKPGILYSYAAVSVDGSSNRTQSGTQIFQLCSGTGTTNVNGTINNFYEYGPYTITWTNESGQSVSPTLCGVSLTQTYSGTLDGNGTFSAVLGDVNQIVPSPSEWTFGFKSFGGTIGSFTSGITITGSTQNISPTIQTAAVGILQHVFYDPATTSFYPPISGSGTVTSVGLAGPTGIVITNSPVTSGGTLTWAMPAGWTTGDLLIGNGTNSVARLAQGTNGQFLGVSGGVLGYYSPSTGASTFDQIGSGTNTTATMQVGTGASLGPTGSGTVTSNAFSGVLPGANGGTNNSSMQFSGPATTLKTYTLPNASTTILTTNALVTVAQGGTGAGTFTTHGVLLGEGTGAIAVTATGTSGQPLLSNGSIADPSYGTLGLSNGGTGATTQQGALNAIAPTPTNPGDVLYYNGTNWTHLAGNTSGTQFLQETSSGVPSWATPAGSGNVSGPGASTIGDLASFDNVSGTLLADTGISSLSIVTATGTLTSGQIITGAGTKTLQTGDLTGDVTTSGTTATTVIKVHGVTYGATPSTNTVPVVTASNTVTYETVPITAGGTGATTQQAALNALAPTPTRAGDVIYYNGTNWVGLAGNNSGTNFLQENSSGVPSWASSSATPCTTTANSFQYNNGGAFGCTATLTWSSTNGVPTLAVGTITTDINPFAITWTNNASGTTFGGIKWTLTDTASGASSKVFQILGGSAGTTGLISIDKSGNEVLGGSLTAGSAGGVGGTITMPEGTTASGSAANDVCYADSTLHGIECSYNNNSFLNLPLETGTMTSGHMVSVNATTNLLQDSGIASSAVVTAGSALTANRVAIGNGSETLTTSASLVFSGSTLTIGATGATGAIALSGTTSGTVTVQPQGTAGTYNFNLPTSAGTSGQPLLSGGGGSSPMTFGTVGVAAGGTGITSGTSGGILGFTATGTIASSAALASKQVVIGAGAGATPTAIDFPQVLDIPAANCNNATAGAGWGIGSGGTVTCRAGTNNKGGYIAITDTSTTFATFQIALPEDWDTATNPYIRFQVASTDTTTGHTIIPSIQVACYKGDGSTTDDVAANAAHSLSTITLNTTANQFWSTANVQMNSTDMTGCVAGALMQVTVGRATDTATNAEFYSATVTIPRLITVQAN